MLFLDHMMIIIFILMMIPMMDHTINIVIGSGIGPDNGSYNDPNIQLDDDSFIGSYIDPYVGSHV